MTEKAKRRVKEHKVAYPSKEPQMIQAREIAHIDVMLWAIADFMAINIDIFFAIDANGAARFRYDAANH